ncbi:prenyltransferase/squalene oxidase repeat-containing protein [Aeoliella sp.]|uniref:prenyltransferase/squalene oxidase repeat-containing protein n=1 Tax=Aeoliella sp. TaxID=2795800 RepID=UPI003CCC21AE
MAKSHSSSDLPSDAPNVAVADPPAEAKDPAGKSARRQVKEKEKQAQSEEEYLDDDDQGFFGRMMSNSASWMISVVVHMIAIIILALCVIDVPSQLDSLLSATTAEEISDEVVDVPEVDFNDVDVEIEPEDLDFQPDTEVIEEVVSESPFMDELEAAAPVDISDFGLTSAPEAITANANAFAGNALEGRGHESRAALVRAKGGSAESEEAVEAALKWLASHQNRDGTWHLDHRGGGDCNGQCGDPGEIENSLKSGTALALLPFLGAGQTRYEGKYKAVVGRGLDALVRLGEKPRKGAGVAWTDGGTMYAHGLSAIAMTEAYGMTGESQLALPAQAAIDYIVSSQNPNDGGWRYSFQQPGDTSVVGWQIMALKSAHLAHLNVPHSTVEGSSRFLDFVQVDDYGTGYSYTPEAKNYRPSTSAVGLLCRMYLGWKRDHQAIIEGTEKIAKIGPSRNDFYYNYYAAQLVFQYTNGTGPMWREWNTKLRDFLVNSQEKEGHLKGSWHVNHGHDTQKGGRLYCTALACMTLEVYYRHMPIYQTDAVESEFPE